MSRREKVREHWAWWVKPYDGPLNKKSADIATGKVTALRAFEQLQGCKSIDPPEEKK